MKEYVYHLSLGPLCPAVQRYQGFEDGCAAGMAVTSLAVRQSQSEYRSMGAYQMLHKADIWLTRTAPT